MRLLSDISDNELLISKIIKKSTRKYVVSALTLTVARRRLRAYSGCRFVGLWKVSTASSTAPARKRSATCICPGARLRYLLDAFQLTSPPRTVQSPADHFVLVEIRGSCSGHSRLVLIRSNLFHVRFTEQKLL